MGEINQSKFGQDGVAVFTDGSSDPNPGVGGWAAVLLYKHVARVIGGYAKKTTNNRMEAQAIYCALKALKRTGPVTFYTDSMYVIHCMNKTLRGILPDKNADIWKPIMDLLPGFEVGVEKVPAHANIALNELADATANACRIQQQEIDRFYNDNSRLHFGIGATMPG